VKAGATFSVRETLAGKRVLLTGASGFLGKVWLAMVLHHVPQIGRVYVLLRGSSRGGGRGPRERFEKIVGSSPVFKPLHEALGERMSEFVSRRIEVVAGDVGEPGLGLDPAIAARLRRDVDVVLNFAGLVDFNPDVREALSANVDGAVNAAEFVASCERARLLHVSTCYVAGHRDGRIPETIVTGRTPSGAPIAAEAEYAKLREIIADTVAENDDPDTEAKLRDDVVERLGERGDASGRATGAAGVDERRVKEMVGRLKRKRLRETMTRAGTDRAKALGWPNTYTYTKALAELMLVERAEPGRFAILRPAIVESAVDYPFAGWNEGFNTSGPLVYLAGTWFRHVPACRGNPLDVIPVDLVCRALLTVTCALLRGEAEPVYQVGSSDRNFLAIDRLTELSALGHRRHLREHGAGKLEKLVLSRWDAIAADPEHVLKVTNIRKVVQQITRYLKHGKPEKIPSEVREWAEDFSKTTERATRKLRQIEEVLELFMPFTYEHYTVFEARTIDRHSVLEPEFRFRPEDIEWRSYWLDVHMPGLRRWCFPEYEDKERETYAPKVQFELLDPPADEPSAPDVARTPARDSRQETG
jgi:long-chain acyl-CoA synthetase